jgi:hypothetical protein
MKSRFSFLLLVCLTFTLTKITLANESPKALAHLAISENPVESSAAIAELRALGPNGLQTLFETYAGEIQRHVADPGLPSTPAWSRIATALDAVSQQKNSYLSGLYWYTDLREAQRVAKQSGKPILSLRLLGKLSDDRSCANSRFFRTVLYSNTAIANLLRADFVLHWQAVRPVPLITIDFGDGRRLERTITGNSIHYVLDSQGNLIDGLPGVYGPQAFSRLLKESEVVFREVQSKNQEERRMVLAQYYRERLNQISLQWYADNKKIGGKEPQGVLIQKGENGEALSVMPLAVSKAVTEATMLRAMTAGADALGKITDEDTWTKLATLHSAEARLDESSIGLIKHQINDLPDSEKTMKALLQKFQLTVALDTVRNEYKLHSKLYAWLISDRGRSDVDTMNEKVYAELFLTPKSDPWLGLLQMDTYTGLENAGVVLKP